MKKFLQKRWLRVSAVALGISALLAISVPASNAVTSNPVANCVDGTCYVTFDYSGDYYYWVPPTGINSLHFDVYGAQGGRLGGKGGAVSGDMQNLTAGLYIYVGGAGGSGNTVAGGFNGGGVSGSGHADAGSGGGASDIRLSTSVADRIVVAGGGGGTGGWIGGAGAPGGLTIAAAGSKGSTAGTAGGGGTQLAGGSAGLGVTTGNGTAGQLLTGGNGGNGSVAGGGGGGGGFFGGGGGGSDSVSGGSDGAGGGGGSSFATMALTANITHQAGVRSGAGAVVLRYTYAPTVNAFQWISRNDYNNSYLYRLAFDQYVYDLTPDDLQLTGTASPGCVVSNIYGDGYAFQFELYGCSNGVLNVGLRANSVYGATAGPSGFVAAQPVTIDTQNPGFKIISPASPTASEFVKFTITGDEAFIPADPSAFQVLGAGCQIVNWPMVNANSMEVWLSGCQSGSTVSIQIAARSIRDLQGNLGPNSPVGSPTVYVDREAPSVSTMASDGSTADMISYRIEFNEPVTNVAPSSFGVVGSGCVISKLDGGGSQYLLWLTGCAEAPVLTLKAKTATDFAGNVGPLNDVVNGNGSIDQVAPAVQFQETSRPDRGVSPSFQVSFSEPVVGFTLNSLTRVGSAKGCTFSLSEITPGRLFQIRSSSCGQGSLRLTLPALAVADLHGNAGPLVSTESSLVYIDSTPTSLPITPARVSPVSNPAVVGNPLGETPGVVSHLKPTAGKPKENQLLSSVVQSFDQVPPQGWFAATALMLGAAFIRRAIRR